ncbi:MAG: expansin EXLX1 family cellulose-binding protein [Actinoplanes sp.]
MTAHRLAGPRWLAPRWLATGGAVVLAAAVGVTLLLQNSGSACAAPPSSAKHSGKATFYDLAGGQGNCSFAPPADDLYVALGKTEYSGATSCGSYIDVTGPKGKVRVKVFDSCPECPVGHLDLSRTAFKKIADEVQGVVPITYKAVPNAPTPGPLTIEFKEGSSQYWWAVQVDNNSNPIKSLQAKGPGGDWMTASLEDYNFWIIDRQTGSGPFQVRMTDIYGKTITAKNIKLQPEKKQATSVRFATGTTSVASAPKKPKPAAKKKASPSPSASPSASASSSAAPVVPLETTEPAVEQDLALAAAAPAVKTSCG